MTVYIYQDNALDLMTQIEGERWREKQLAITSNESSDWGVSFNAFLAEYRRLVARDVPLRPDTSIYVYDRGVGSPVIYGHHGWNRYALRGDGSIEFLTMQARCDEDADMAEKLGFTMFPNNRRTLLGG